MDQPQPSSDPWKNLFDQAADAILVVRPAPPGGSIAEANPEAARLTGYSVDELKTLKMVQLFSLEEHHREPMTTAPLEAGLVVRKFRILTRRDGSTVPIEMKTRKASDGNYHTVIRDMVDHLKAEEALRFSEEKFAKAFKTSPDAITITRLSDGVYMEINEGYTALSGYTPDEVLGRSSLPGDVGIWQHATDRENVVAQLKKTGYVRGYEAPFLMKDGRIIIGLLSARMMDIRGEPYLLSVTRDVTEKKKTEEALQKTEKLEALGVLAGGIAHDFNNLLTGIFGYVANARDQLAPDSPARASLESALGVFDRAKGLSHQLLTFAKGGAPVKQTVHLPSLIRETSEFALSGSHIKAHVTVAPDLWTCQADGQQIGQVLDNLVLNARQAMPAGGKVTVTARNVPPGPEVPPHLPQGPYVQVEVADEGMGIREDHLSKVFDPFFTTKTRGTGLGLATAFSVLQRHGGHITVESEPGRGARFTFYLPAAPGTEKRTETKTPPATVKKAGKILVFDDELFIREVAAKTLTAAGYRVDTAASGASALELVREALALGERFGLAVLDLTIPGEDGGWQVLRALRELDPGLKAVASSGYSDDPVMAAPDRFGFQASLAKPYRENELLALVDRLL